MLAGFILITRINKPLHSKKTITQENIISNLCQGVRLTISPLMSETLRRDQGWTFFPAGAAAHLNKEEAGCRGRVMVDVDCDQHACNHDKHHQQDAQDQTSVKRMSAFHPVYSTVSWHHWKTKQEVIMLSHTHSVCYFRLLSTAGLIITLCHMLKASVIFSLVLLQFCCRPAGDTHYSSIRSFPACADMP